MTSTAPADVENVTDAQVAQAEREATEAAALVDALEDRVRDGDDTVTPEEIEQARSLVRFAQLRAEATARKAERAKAAAHAQALAQLRADILDDVNGGGPGLAAVAAALAGVDEAIGKFLDAANTHNAWHDAIRARIRDLSGTAPSDLHGGDEESGLAFADPGHSTLGAAYVAVHDAQVEAVTPGELLAAVVYQAARSQVRDQRSSGLPMHGGYTGVDWLLRADLTSPDEFYADKRERLAVAVAELAPAAAPKGRRGAR